VKVFILSLLSIFAIVGQNRSLAALACKFDSLPKRICFVSIPPGQSKVLILNPYESINWSSIVRAKANFHAHTTHSDGQFYPHEVIDHYNGASYKILSLTDHNLVTYPWTGLSVQHPLWDNRDPQLLGMLDVEGIEWSSAHHAGSYLPAINPSTANLTQTMDTMSYYGGVCVFNHPGRYWSIDSVYQPNQEYSPDWYELFFQSYPNLLGLEVYNQGNRHTDDRVLWDEILGRLMPNRPVWGYSNDDLHVTSQLFRNYNFMLVSSLTHSELRISMVSGASWFCYEPGGSGNALAPSIDSIKVDRIHHTIIISASGVDSIQWISGVSGTWSMRLSRIIASGDTFFWNNMLEPYVRAVLIGPYGRTYTQPFGFDFKIPHPADTIFGANEICEGGDTLVYCVDEDVFTEIYCWEFPNNTQIIGSANGPVISVVFPTASATGYAKVWKQNLSGLSDTTQLFIKVNPLPQKPGITLIGTHLQSSSPTGNQWYDQNGPIGGANQQTFTPSVNGVYYVVVGNNACYSEPSETFSFSTGMEENGFSQARLYPNPGSDIVTITFSKPSTSSISLQLYTSTGEMLSRMAAPSGTLTLQIDLNAYSSGVYFLIIEQAHSTKTLRLIIAK
jgi:hypothetical protein